MNVFLYLNIINICRFDEQPLLTAGEVDGSDSKKTK